MARHAEESLPIGVVIEGDDPVAALRRVRSLGIGTCQMYAPPLEWCRKSNLHQIEKAILETGVRITSLVCHYEGESYADTETTRKTVGFLNPATRWQRVEKTFAYSDFAGLLGIPALMAHIGFIPKHRDHPDYQGMVEVVRKIADHCKGNRQKYALETGQEKDHVLSRFIRDVNRTNLGVNFDPANMLSYGTGDPIEALARLGKYVIGVHCKDARGPRDQGGKGKQYPLGEGDVGIERFIGKLKEIGYTGPLTIEREISGEQQTKDILRAKELLEKLR